MKNYFGKLNKKVGDLAIRTDFTVKRGIRSLKKPLKNNNAWGRDEIIGIAIALVIAGFVMVPQLRTFATTVATTVSDWFTTTMKSKIFPTT